MADAGRQEFDARISRLRHQHAQGQRFVAAGTLRAHGTRPRGSRVQALGPTLMLLALALMLKAVLMVETGRSAWEARVDRLWTGSGIDRMTAVLMQPDPVTIWIADRLMRVH